MKDILKYIAQSIWETVLATLGGAVIIVLVACIMKTFEVEN